MADEAALPPPSPVQPVDTGPTQMISPDNGLVYNVQAGQSEAYAARGWRAYGGPRIDDDSILRTFRQWRGSAEAAGTAAVNQVPFLDYGLEKLAPDTAKEWAEHTAETRRDHPTAYTAGAIAGQVGQFAAGGAAVKGGLALAEVANPLAKLALAGRWGATAATAAEGALGGAASNIVDQVDQQALDHAMSPEGQEKLAFHYGDLAWSTALGGFVPGALKGASELSGWASGRLVERGEDTLRKAIIDDNSLKALKDEGKGHLVENYIMKHIRSGQKGDDWKFELLRDMNHAGQTLEDTLYPTRDKVLNIKDTRRIVKRAETLLKDKAGTDDLKPLQAILESHDAADKAIARAAKQRQKVKELEFAFGKMSGDVPKDMLAKATSAMHGTAREAEEAVAKRLSLPRDIDLQQVHKKLYARIYHPSPIDHETYQKLRAAGEAISAGREAIGAEHVGKVHQLRIRREKAQFSDLAALAERLAPQHLKGVFEGLTDRVQNSALAGGMLALVNLKSGGIAGSAAQAAAWAALHHVGNQDVARLSMYAGNKVFPSIERNLAKVVKLGLYGGLAGGKLVSTGDYQDFAARALVARHNPVTVTANIDQALQAKGVPDQIRQGVTLRATNALVASGKALPPRQGAPDIASAVQPDPYVQRTWLGETKSRMDPTYALTHPTKRNMDAAKQHHPETIMRTQEAILHELSRNPYLPAASKAWAARVLGRPVGALTSPAFYQNLQQQRAQADHEAAQAGGDGPAKPRGNAAAAAVNYEQTRLGELNAP